MVKNCEGTGFAMKIIEWWVIELDKDPQ